MDGLTRTWLWLVGLTAVTTLLAGWPVVAGVALPMLALFKARAILGGFLHLRAAPGWLTAITLPLALWLVLIAGLYAL